MRLRAEEQNRAEFGNRPINWIPGLLKTLAVLTVVVVIWMRVEDSPGPTFSPIGGSLLDKPNGKEPANSSLGSLHPAASLAAEALLPGTWKYDVNSFTLRGRPASITHEEMPKLQAVRIHFWSDHTYQAFDRLPVRSGTWSAIGERLSISALQDGSSSPNWDGVFISHDRFRLSAKADRTIDLVLCDES